MRGLSTLGVEAEGPESGVLKGEGERFISG